MTLKIYFISSKTDYRLLAHLSQKKFRRNATLTVDEA